MRHQVRWIGTTDPPVDHGANSHGSGSGDADPVASRLRNALAASDVDDPTVSLGGDGRVSLAFVMTGRDDRPVSEQAAAVVAAATAAAGLAPAGVRTVHLNQWVLGPLWLLARRDSGRWTSWAGRDARAAAAPA